MQHPFYFIYDKKYFFNIDIWYNKIVTFLTEGIYKLDKKKIKYEVCTYFPREYVVFDLEATGTAEFNYIIELSAFKVSNGKITDEFSTLIKPPKCRLFSKRKRRVQSYCIEQGKKIYYVDKFIENLTGIDNNMIHEAAKESDAIENFYEFIGKNILIGHGTGNDLNLINRAFNRVLKKDLENQYLDTFLIALFLDEKEYSLVNLCNRFSIENNNIHRARSDAYRTFLCYEKLVEEANLRYGIESASNEFVTWENIRRVKQTKILKNKMMRNINRNNWSVGKKELEEIYDLKKVFDEKNITISKKLKEKEYRFLTENLTKYGAKFLSKLGIKTDYYIASSEIAPDKINLENKKIRKIINMNVRGENIRILEGDNLIELMKKECCRNENLSLVKFKEIEFDKKVFFIYNDFSTEKKEDVTKEILEKGGEVSNKLNTKVDYVLVGEGRDREIFQESKEYETLLVLLAFGFNIWIYNESYYLKLKSKKESIEKIKEKTN